MYVLTTTRCESQSFVLRLTPQLPSSQTLRSPIRSPCSGTVQTLLCSENQRVQKGDDLVAIVSTEDADNDGPFRSSPLIFFSSVRREL
jgi:multidrug resistance efflux pump